MATLATCLPTSVRGHPAAAVCGPILASCQGGNLADLVTASSQPGQLHRPRWGVDMVSALLHDQGQPAGDTGGYQPEEAHMVNSTRTTSNEIPNYVEASRQVILMADHMPWPAANRYAGRYLWGLIDATKLHIGDDATLDQLDEAIELVSDYLMQREMADNDGEVA